MMNYRDAWRMVGLVAFGAVTLVGSEALAQRRYTPPRPTFSPAFNYFRQDTGLLDPYNAIYRPQQQLQASLGSINSQLNAQRDQVESLRSDLLQVRGLETQGTGAAARFQSQSTYFGNNQRYFLNRTSPVIGGRRR